MFKTAVIIGRFQPCHEGHLNLIRTALEVGEKVIVIIGSHNKARSSKNPFTTSEREQIIKDNLLPHQLKRISFGYVEDRLNNNYRWVTNIKKQVYLLCEKLNDDIPVSEQICIVGHEKDRSLYNKLLPDWSFKKVYNENTYSISATEIRKYFFTNHSPELIFGIPTPTVNFLKKFKYGQSEEYFLLAEEFQYLKEYNKKWDITPHPVNFVAVDAVVYFDNKILIITRKNPPGKGQFALPGGFLDRYEIIKDAAIRELIEETSITLSPETIESRFKGIEVFDAPSRSERGRIITHAHFFDLSGLTFNFQAADDASEVFTLEVKDLHKFKTSFYSDHYEIIESTLKKFLNIDLEDILYTMRE